MSAENFTMEPPRKKLCHLVPPNVPDNRHLFFLTICGEPRGKNQFANDTLFPEMCATTQIYNEQGRWWADILLAMPDHLHLIAHLPETSTLSKIIGGWKLRFCKRFGIRWQRNFFDHRLRGDESLSGKFEYIVLNPVRAGLVDEPEDWPYVWRPNG